MIRPFSLALLAVAGLAACQEKLAAPAECPDLCPGNFDVRDTVITPVLGSDSAFEGYLQPGLGGSPHMSGELLKLMAKVDLVHVPYKGGGPMLLDLIGGQIQVAFDNLPSAMVHIQAGKVRALAVTTVKRWPASPEIPTLAEAGVPGYEMSAWFGLVAPGGTPAATTTALQREVAAILELPEVKKQFFALGAEPGGNTPEEFARFIAADRDKWARVGANSGVKLE